MSLSMRRDGLFWALTAYLIASLIHFVHNAEFLADYPHMPSWLTRGGVYTSWAAIAASGVAGYTLMRMGVSTAGRVLLTITGVSGVLVLTHYLNAGPSMHTLTMNLTIVLEATAALFLLGTLARGAR